MDIVKLALNKTEMIRFVADKKKPFGVYLSILTETYELVCTPVKPVKPNAECIVSFTEIKEIRPGKASKDFEVSPEGKKCDSSKCFVLFYGTEFNLKSLSLCVESQTKNLTSGSTGSELIKNIIRGLEILKRQNISYPLKIEIWLQKCFQSMNLNGIITLKQITNQYMNKINLKMPAEKLTELFESYGEGLAYGIKFQGFSSLTKHLLHNRQIFTDCFVKYCLNAEQLSKDGFEEFLFYEQQMAKPITVEKDILKEYFKAEGGGKFSLTIGKAVDFLFSKENQIWDTKYNKVYQDMTHPLPHYWIASSHNTYLTRDQIYSDSSVESYIRALRQGCRCIEIDCFDGGSGSDGPVVYHGRTLTSRISFIEVLYAIRDHAFVTSEYPVIISIENHCSIEYQKIMASKFMEIFGSMLVTKPLQEKETQLPSPEDLKGRIILKGQTDDQPSAAECTTAVDMNVSEARKTGKMYLQNQYAKWEPFFFALMDNKLRYNAIEEKEIKNEHPEVSVSVLSEELHFKEKWFHGDIVEGKEEAARRVQAHNVEGCFLVRNSSVTGEYALCLLSQGRAYHLRIASIYDSTGQRLFYLNPDKTFDNLYLLITHYRRYPLDTKTFTIERFTASVPPPDKHETEPWFHKNLDRGGAEAILANIPITGAFLVRYAREGTRFAISFRIDKLIKHCRINEDGRLLMVSDRKFESISELVRYYSEHTFYKWVKLAPPVTPELRRNSEDNPSTAVNVMTQPGYLCTVETQVRAIRDCIADTPSAKISFRKGDVISNVEKLEGDFWRGDLGDQVQKLFPKDFTELIETPESPFGSLRKGMVDISDVQAQINSNPDKNFPFIVTLTIPNMPLSTIRAAIKREKDIDPYSVAKDWVTIINDTHKELKIPAKSKKPEKKSKIASELSQLIVYAGTVRKPVPADIAKNGRLYNKIASFSESVGEKLTYSDPNFFPWFTQIQLTRIFPKGSRIDSSNYNPSSFWNEGCQLTALNYQTPEKHMQLNRGKFRQNGNCGYILKPEFLLKDEFNPNDPKYLATYNIKPVKLKLKILAGRHIFRSEKGIMSPFVEVEIIGAPFDCQKVQTRTIVDNGLNPFWNHKFIFEIKNSELALIRFCAYSEDMFGDADFIGEATYPVNCLHHGYRSVQLMNGYGEELLAVLLVHVKIDQDLS